MACEELSETEWTLIAPLLPAERGRVGRPSHDNRRALNGILYLRERGFSRIVLCGLATDFCVTWSALDARREGFESVVVEEACRAIDLDGSLAKARSEMRDAGVNSQAWNSGSLGPSAESSNDDRLRDALLPLGTADRRVREGEGWSEMLVGCARVSKADGSQVLDL